MDATVYHLALHIKAVLDACSGSSLWYTKRFEYFCAFKSIESPIRKHFNPVNHLRPCMLTFLLNFFLKNKTQSIFTMLIRLSLPNVSK